MSSAWILGLSVFFSLNCLGFMSQVLCGLLIAMAVLCHIESSKRKTRIGSWIWMAGAFICLAGSALVRPFSALCAGTALIAAWTIRWNRSAIVRFLLCSALFAAVVIAATGMQNKLLTGSYTRSPYNATGGRMREISFRPGDLWEGLTRYIPRRLVDTGSTAFPYIYVLALYGLWRRRKERVVWALALCFLCLVLGYAVETVDSDSPIGERYYF